MLSPDNLLLLCIAAAFIIVLGYHIAEWYDDWRDGE